LLGARLELSPSLPSSPLSGRIFYISSSVTGYDGVDFNNHFCLASVDGANSLDKFRFMPGMNRHESITGKWTFAPTQTETATTVGLNTAPPSPATPQAIGTLPAFAVGGQSRLPTDYQRAPDADGSDDFLQPTAFPKRYTPSWAQHSSADLLDGYHASLSVAAYLIPVRTHSGHIRVPVASTEATHAASKQYVDDHVTGIRIRTPVAYATDGPLPAYSFNSTTHELTATANGSLVVDGQTPFPGQRIMVRLEGDKTRNCIATVTQGGSGGAPWILEVVDDDNLDPDGLGENDYGDYFLVENGDTLAGSTWVMSATGTEGEIAFSLFQVSQPLSGGRGISISSAKVNFWKSDYSADWASCPISPWTPMAAMPSEV
jgi:hypothetical protein